MKETRAFPLEARAEDKTLIGHAATYDDPYPIGDFEEVIARGAFDDAIENDDVRALWNHDPNYPLGRTKSGTLRLSSDKTGLLSEIDLPESATMIREAIERGDVDQMSFGFSVVEEEWVKRDKKPDLRTIRKVKLFDVSPVTYPANPNTDVAFRSHDDWQQERDREEQERRELEEWAEKATERAEEMRKALG